jgi:hypothetical protein
MNPAESISFINLIVTIITTMIVPLVQKPLLDYYVTEPRLIPKDPKNFSQSEIKIYNFGIVAAKHVIGSMKGENITFLDFTSDPFLSKYFTDNSDATKQIKDGFFELGILPPWSGTIITAKMNITNSTASESNSSLYQPYNTAYQPLVTYIRSDEGVGYANYIANLTKGAHIAFLIITPIIFVFLLRMKY